MMLAPMHAVPPLQVADLARAARQFIQRATGCDIDTSEESLAFVDHYVATVRQGGQVSDEALALLSAALGVHLGEVAIAKYGGCWRAIRAEEGDAEDPTLWRVELTCVPLWFDPIGMAAEALRQGEVEGYEAGLGTRPDLYGPLHQALARAAPVTDDYYYSLTGRLETIGYAVELLTEIQRQQQEDETQQHPRSN